MKIEVNQSHRHSIKINSVELFSTDVGLSIVIQPAHGNFQKPITGIGFDSLYILSSGFSDYVFISIKAVQNDPQIDRTEVRLIPETPFEHERIIKGVMLLVKQKQIIEYLLTIIPYETFSHSQIERWINNK